MTEQHHAHTAEFWAGRRRDLDTYTVSECRDTGDAYEILTTDSTGFVRSKTDFGPALEPGERFELETIGFSTITGLRVDGRWRFRLTDDQLAADARKLTESIHRSNVEILERNRKKWWAIEQDLPDWIRTRITHFRDAAGEKFLVEGWGYELCIAQLAVAYAEGTYEDGDRLAGELGATGNQVGMAKGLAEAHKAGRDDLIAGSPAAMAPITGSRDYT